MNKKFLSAILFGALVASAGSFVSCADNDSKIDQLQNQNDQLKAELAKIQAELKAELQTANASQAAAIEAKLSAIENATAQNLAATVAALKGDFDTQESRVVALETQIKALEAIQNEDAAAIIAEINKAKERDNNEIEKLSEMVNALDADVNVLVSSLRALVFQPEFYLDGIEAAEYTYLHYVALNSTSDKFVNTGKNYDGNPVTIDDSFVWRYAHVGDIDLPVLNGEYHGDYYTESSEGNANNEGYGFAKNTGVGVPNTVQFAVNPSNAQLNLKMVLKDIAAFTRAAEENVKVISAVTKNGIATVTYEIADPDVLITANNKEGDFKSNLYKTPVKVNTTVFKLVASVDADVTVESDWGVLYENAVQPVAIAKTANSNWNVSNTCSKTELYKNPYEALAAQPTFKLAYNDEKGVNMAEHIQLHFVKKDLENTEDKLTAHFNVSLKDAYEKYGLTYKFIPVPYSADGNVTKPTNYSTLTDAEGTANVVANIVDETTGLAKTGVQGESSVGKQPLYQVLVYKGTDVVLDAYVKIIISREIAPIVSEPLPVPAKTYNCTGIDYATTWYQFSTIVLQNACKMSKIEFEAKYKLDVNAAGEAIQYSAPGTAAAPAGTPKADIYTAIKYDTDPEETTNHIFTMSLDECAQQYLIEKKEGKDVIYVKFISKDDTYADMAIDPEVFVPIAIEVKDRTTVLDYLQKNINMWFAADGTPTTTPDEAIRFNVNVPDYEEGVKDTKVFVSDLNDYWHGKKLQFKEGENVYTSSTNKQYYFHPQTNGVKVTDEYDGTVYTLSVESDEVLCHIWTNDVHAKHSHVEKVTAENTINALETAHKVYVNYGVYNNNKLYATVGSATTKTLIATLDQVTGIVTYQNNDVAKKVLNAVTHATAQQKAYIGLVAADPCDHAIAINNNVFPAFFLRPIDVTINEANSVIDAKTNGDKVNVFSLFTFMDWRDQIFFDVEKNDYTNAYLIAFYNINKITVDLKNVKTDMNNSDITKTLLTDVNKDVQFSYVDQDGNVKATLGQVGSIEKNLSAYNKLSAGVKSTYTDLVKVFGDIKYKNKGTNVSDFNVVIPVSISYEWGTISKELKITVKGTMANND